MSTRRRLFLYIHDASNDVVASGTLSATPDEPYGDLSVSYSVGSATNVLEGMTIAFGSPAGSAGYMYVKSASGSTISIGKTTKGDKAGQAVLSSGTAFEVRRDYEVWPREPTLDETTGATYKDADIPPIDGGQDRVDNASPYPNPGYNYALITNSLTFDDLSAQVPKSGESASAYAWSAPDGSFSSSTVDQPTYSSIPQGGRWVSKKVTTNQALVTTTNTFVLYDDPDSPVSLVNFLVLSDVLAQTGHKMSFQVFEDLSDYPPNSLVMFWMVEYDSETGAVSRDNYLYFAGRITEKKETIQVVEGRGAVNTYMIDCLDIGEQVKQVKAYGSTVIHKNVPLQWNEQNYPNSDRLLGLPWRWNSTAHTHISLKASGLFANYNCWNYTLQGSSLFDQMAIVADAIAHKLTAKYGILQAVKDPQLQIDTDRSAGNQLALTGGDLNKADWVVETKPIVKEYEGKAGIFDNGFDTYYAYALDAAGSDVKTGPMEICETETELQKRTGARFQLGNQLIKQVTLTLKSRLRLTIHPADLPWIQLDVSSTYSPYSGTGYSGRVQLQQIVTNWITDNTKRSIVRDIQLICQPENEGAYQALEKTILEPGRNSQLNSSVPSLPFPTPLVGVVDYGPGTFYPGQAQKRFCMVGTDGNLYRTVNIQRNGPVWSTYALGGYSGTIVHARGMPDSLHYITQDPDDPTDAIFVTSVAIYKISDVYGAAPSLSTLHTWTTITPANGFIDFSTDGDHIVVMASTITVLVIASSDDSGATWSEDVIYNGAQWAAGKPGNYGIAINPSDKNEVLFYYPTGLNTFDLYRTTSFDFTSISATSPALASLGNRFGGIQWIDADTAYIGVALSPTNNNFYIWNRGGSTPNITPVFDSTGWSPVYSTNEQGQVSWRVSPAGRTKIQAVLLRSVSGNDDYLFYYTGGSSSSNWEPWLNVAANSTSSTFYPYGLRDQLVPTLDDENVFYQCGYAGLVRFERGSGGGSISYEIKRAFDSATVFIGWVG